MKRQKKVLICVNKDFLTTHGYPRQKRKFEKTLKFLSKDDVNTEVLEVEFKGNDSQEVITNIARQLHGYMGRVLDDTTLTLFGDSGVCPVLNGIRANMRENPISEDASLKPNPILVGPCGTMEALARTLRTDSAENVAGVIRGDIEQAVQNILVRKVTMDIYEGEKLLRSKTSDWMLFCGTGLDGEIIKNQESKPRTRSAKLNLAHTGVETLRSIMDKSKGPIVVDSVMTLPFYGPFNLDMEKYNLLHCDFFYNIAFEAKRGWTALPRFVAYNAMGIDSRISETVWEDLYGISEIPDSIKPRFLVDHKIQIYPHDQAVHIDSYPENLNLREGEHAELTFSTTDEIVQVVRAVV